MNVNIEKILPKEFYRDKADRVARRLLGKALIKREKNIVIGGPIVETEAYLGEDDPACLAYIKRKRRLSRELYGEAGKIFIYMVHGNWLFNILVDRDDTPAAVLIRAIEPRYGIEYMFENRSVEDIYRLTNGPGKLTKAMGIDKRYNYFNVADPTSPIIIIDKGDIPDNMVDRSPRIGVREDMDIPLRFYIRGNKFVS